MINDGGGGEATTGPSSSSSSFGDDERGGIGPEGFDAGGAGDDDAEAPRFFELILKTFTSERRLVGGAGDGLVSGTSSPGFVP